MLPAFPPICGKGTKQVRPPKERRTGRFPLRPKKPDSAKALSLFPETNRRILWRKNARNPRRL
jgi:hypothetical protein